MKLRSPEEVAKDSRCSRGTRAWKAQIATVKYRDEEIATACEEMRRAVGPSEGIAGASSYYLGWNAACDALIEALRGQGE